MIYELSDRLLTGGFFVYAENTMATSKLENSNNYKTDININYDQEYDEMSLDLMLRHLELEERSNRNKKIRNFASIMVLLLLYALLIILITMANGRY